MNDPHDNAADDKAIFERLTSHPAHQRGKRDVARDAVIAVVSEDELWQPSDEQWVTVEPTEDPNRFMFAIAGLASSYGCVVFYDRVKPDVYFHDSETMVSCPVCGWNESGDL